MAKTHSFSIYLLKEDFDAANALKEDHSLGAAHAPTYLPKEAKLFILDSSPREPWWKAYFGLEQPLWQVKKGALILLPVKGRWFVLSFGQVSHNLKDIAYEYDFGLRVTLNAVDPAKLKSTDTLEPGPSRRQRIQVPLDSELTYFDIDRDSMVLKRLTGKVRPEYQSLFTSATGASNIRVSSSVTPDRLVELCEKLLSLFHDDAFKNVFPDIQNISPVRDPSTISQLDAKLVAALNARSSDIFLTVPALIDYGEALWAAFSGLGASRTYDDVYIDRYYEYIEEHGQAVSSLTLDIVKRHKLLLTDEDQSVREPFSLYKSLVFDTTIDGHDGAYHLSEGNWYRIETDYVAKLRGFLDPRCSALGLPEFVQDAEGPYNEALALNTPNCVCLDKTNISLAGQKAIEPCDVYTISSNSAVLYHVKVSTMSAQLSHLFNQGINSLELLRQEPAAAFHLKELISKRCKPEDLTALTAPINAGAYRIIYAIITHKDINGRSENLPLFSRISLMRTLKRLQAMNAEASFGYIADKSPKSEGKPKTRKHKQSGDVAGL